MSRRNNLRYNILDDIGKHPSYGIESETHEIGYVHGPAPDRLTLSGIGNTGLRQDFADKIAAMSDDEFVREAEQCIWLSAWAANNLNSDYHWQADACYHEAQRRGNPELYNQAWHKASGM